MESLLGTGAQLLLTTALTGGAVGAARSGLAAARAGGAAEALFASQNAAKASRLFGFHDAAGNFVANSLVGRGANQAVAGIIGKAASSAVLTAPASVIYEASLRADTDQAGTAESFVRDVGIDIALGAAFDFGLPLVGKGLRALGRGAKKVSPLGFFARQYRVGKFLANPENSALFKAEVLQNAVQANVKGWTKNAATRAVGGEAVEGAAKASARRASAVDSLKPSRITTRKQAESLIDTLDSHAGAPGVDPADVAFAAENVGGVAGLTKGVGNFQTISDQVADSMLSHIEGLSIKSRLRRAGDLRVDIALSASELRTALGDQVDGTLKKHIDEMMVFGPGISRRGPRPIEEPLPDSCWASIVPDHQEAVVHRVYPPRKHPSNPVFKESGGYVSVARHPENGKCRSPRRVA